MTAGEEPTGDSSCSTHTRTEALECGKRHFVQAVAGSCVLLTVLKGLPVAEQISYANSYLRQFESSCKPWGNGQDVYVAYVDELLRAPEISPAQNPKVSCASPDGAVFEDLAADKNPAGLLVSRLLLATLTGVAQFHPDPNLSIPAKYLHRYLAGIGGVKVLDEPELVREMEQAIVEKWNRYPAAAGRFLIGYGNYQSDPDSKTRGEELNKQLRLPEGVNGGAQRLPAAFNSLGRGIVTYELITDLKVLSGRAELKPESIENYAQLRTDHQSGKARAQQVYLLAQINDPYSWPGYGGEGTPQTTYSQEKHGSLRGTGSEKANRVNYPGNSFPNLLTGFLKFLLHDKDGQFVSTYQASSSSESGRVPQALGTMGNMRDSTLRAMLNAGARDFQMSKRWLIPIDLSQADFSELDADEQEKILAAEAAQNALTEASTLEE